MHMAEKEHRDRVVEVCMEDGVFKYINKAYNLAIRKHSIIPTKETIYNHYFFKELLVN